MGSAIKIFAAMGVGVFVGVLTQSYTLASAATAGVMSITTRATKR